MFWGDDNCFVIFVSTFFIFVPTYHIVSELQLVSNLILHQEEYENLLSEKKKLVTHNYGGQEFDRIEYATEKDEQVE